ncbi:hypothetical protein GF359_07050 [candidate division WOR-3 bacterium]|uniref:Peptidase MA-like domain-containing protein n=1 Tax=candidate division WOR-3 bacterium TaxID=2052148 RepID=A0A9D5KC07_UNCW3|nr:hypothetical protein [candidate division WOR-3 bacterium]MBD3364956.1 hypothetical protein [candidate division WOR-3 bacterium]
MTVLLLTVLTATSQGSVGAEFASFAREWIAEARSQGTIIDPVDEAIFTRTLEGFGFYLDEAYGERKRERVFARVSVPCDLTDALDKVTGKDFEELYPGFYSWSERGSGPPVSTGRSQSEHFTYYYTPGTAAARDIELIKLAAESAFDVVFGLLGADSTLQGRLERIVYRNQPTGGRIPVTFYQARTQIRGPDKILGGETVFKPEWKSDTVVYILEIRLAYPGSAGLYGIPHEMAHALTLLFLADEAELTPLLRDRSYSLINSLAQALPRSDYLRSEGWAYSVQFNHFTYARLGLMQDSKERSRRMLEKNCLPGIDEIITSEVEKTLKEKFLAFIGFGGRAYNQRTARLETASADLMRFLGREYGPASLRQFLTQPGTTERAMIAVYGKTPGQIEKEWRRDITRQGRN